MSFDLIIRNAKVINGTGAPWFIADVAVKNGKIMKIGKLTNENGNEEISANENYLSPGFFDTHTHDDIEMIRNPIHHAKLFQGVTTIVTGNCSFSNYPSTVQSNQSKDLTKEQLSSLLGDIKNSEIFQDFNGYSERLKSQGIALNVISLVGHGPIRLSVMGYEKRKSTKKEIEKMCQILETQIQQGAQGLSFGLMYAPSGFSEIEEMIALASIVKKYHGIVASHIRSYSGDLFDAINEFIHVLKSSGAKGLLSHLQVAGSPYFGSMDKAIKLIEQARHDGVDIVFDMYPYKAGSSSILCLLPPSVQENGIENLIECLGNKINLEDLKRKTESEGEAGWESKIKLIGWHNVVICSVTCEKLKCFEGKSIADAANHLNISAFDFTMKIIKEDKGTSCIIMFQQSDQDQLAVHQSRLQMVGSDGVPRQSGKPHPRQYGTFPKVIGRFAMNDKLIPLEEIIRRCTSLPATRFNIHNRGIIAEGMIADLALFSHDFIDKATYQQPNVFPTGLIGSWIKGIRVVNNGKFTNNFPGRVIRINEN